VRCGEFAEQIGGVFELMSKRGTERRKHVRYAVRIRIRYRTADQFFQDYVQNISMGGIFVETTKPLSEGTRLSVEFSLPGMRVPISADGVVVHRLSGNRGSDASGNGMGIRFSELDEKSKRLLEEYVRRSELTPL
jgi:uncharacterized protein (TIGR02266 family)